MQSVVLVKFVEFNLQKCYSKAMPETDDPILKVADLHVSFGPEDVISGLDFEVKNGEVVAIVGPNGAGKSVLFRALLNLIPHKGEIHWKHGIKLGYVPQKLYIEPGFPLSVGEFLYFKSKSHANITKALESVGIKDMAHIHAGETISHHSHFLDQQLGFLSGGELQRVLIAWAIIDNPGVLLFDEPTAGIDIGGEETIYNLLHDLQKKRKLTVLLISHDLNIVYKYANTVLCINKHQLCFGEPSLVLDPKSLSSLYGGEAKFYAHDEHSH